MTLNSGYTWNDIIDPNYEYSTDKKKNGWAEIITLGQADPYDMHITWHAQTKVIVDASGNVVDMKGYPASWARKSSTTVRPTAPGTASA